MAENEKPKLWGVTQIYTPGISPFPQHRWETREAAQAFCDNPPRPELWRGKLMPVPGSAGAAGKP